MEAVVFHQPSENSDFTSVQDLPTPAVGAGQVLIDVEFAGVNYIDIMARRGDPGYASSWPFVPGLEVVGAVAATGSDRSRYHVGQRVAAFTSGGGLAQQAVADELLVVSLPASVDGATGAAAPLMLSTALLLLRDASRFVPGDTVLMHSVGGGVGSAVAQLVAALGGGRLIGTVGDASKQAAARAAGWDHVLVRGDRLAAHVKDVAPSGADVILDPLGTTMLDFDLSHAAAGGRIVLFGNPGADTLAHLPPVGRLIGGNLSVGGFSISRLSRSAPHQVARALREVLDLLADGRLGLAVNVVDGLQEVPSTHDLLARGRSTGKHVIRVS